MDQIYPDNGLVTFLTRMVTPGWLFHLYTNNYTPTLGDTLANYTEATFAGYAAQAALAAAWTFSQVSAHVGALQAPNVSFSNTSGSSQSVYGYYITDAAATVLLGAARFDSGPIVIPTGQSQGVTPILSNSSLYSS